MVDKCEDPPAGVVSLPRPKNATETAGGPIDTSYLSASHFSIAQDKTVIQPAYKSIFKRDYLPWKVDSKPDAAKPPRPASLLQSDDRYFNERASETKQAYEYNPMEKPPLQDASGKLRATNFKMDRDPKFNSFQTTHNVEFTPKELPRDAGSAAAMNRMKSFIPQGDRDKAAYPLSENRDRYQAHDVGKPERITGRPPGPSTIRGDQRQQNYNTTHDDTYRGKHYPRLEPILKNYDTHIPQGDPSQVRGMLTIQQESYPVRDVQARDYDKSAITRKLQSTNFRQNDGHGAWDKYVSTMTESYQPHLGKLERQAPCPEQNRSDIPSGDTDPYRNADRAVMTTHKISYGNPPPTKLPVLVSGENRTASNVCIGLPELSDKYYETTMDTTYKAVPVQEVYQAPHNNTNSDIPLDYYADESNVTTYKNSYLNPKQGVMVLDERALEKIRSSNIHPPLGRDMMFSTEHLDQFTPKSFQPVSVDTGKLQLSSVPIGTLYK